jgi:hypothetical protein
VTDIFREVDEDIRQEQLTDFLRNYWIKIVAAMVVLIAAYAAINYWQNQQQQEVASASDEFNAAMEQLEANNTAAAISGLARVSAERGMEDYGLLASFRQAEALVAQGKANDAIAIYEAIAADGGVDEFLQDLASLYAASALVGGDRVNEGMERLDALAADDSPLRFSALEMKGYSLFSAGKRDEARDIFTMLQSEAPEGTGYDGRAAQMLTELGSSEAAAE